MHLKMPHFEGSACHQDCGNSTSCCVGVKNLNHLQKQPVINEYKNKEPLMIYDRPAPIAMGGSVHERFELI